MKECLLRGLVRDRRIGKLEKRMTAAGRSIDTIIYTLLPTLPANRKPIRYHHDIAKARVRIASREIVHLAGDASCVPANPKRIA